MLQYIADEMGNGRKRDSSINTKSDLILQYGENMFKRKYPDGKIYFGELKGETWHGRGKVIYENGIVIEGRWADGVIQEGRERCPNRSRFEGSWKNWI